MIKKEINLSEVAEYFKDNQVPTFDEDIDRVGQYFITAGRIAAVIIAPDPISKIAVFCAGIDAGSIQVSKLFSWLPDKFKWGKKGRERFAIDRYELSSAINLKLLDIAIRNSLKEFIMPLIEVLLKEIELVETSIVELKNLAEKTDEELKKYSFINHTSLSQIDLNNYATKLVDPILNYLLDITVEIEIKKKGKKRIDKIDLQETKRLYLNKINVLYNAFIINFSSEFPEFAIWSDVTKRSEILKELNKISRSLNGNDLRNHKKFIKEFKQLTSKIEQLDEKVFSPESGFPSFKKTYEELFKLQTERIENKLTERVRDNIRAHQKQIKLELTNPLSDNTDIDEIIYPKNKDIFISQSFQAINYKKKNHRKSFLTSDSLGEQCEFGEDIGKYLLKTLVNPIYSTKPIIILGNPGAGKSMLSKMFAGELSETNDFIPFLIKLRNVASSSANISEHINKGLSLSIENTSEINWLDWAKEFKERTPVIIMDGFDELMQSSSTELNGYVNTIKEFQEKALNFNICVRVILTSRITVMQDVSIPEGTKIIKLNSFDEKRRNLWVEKWNSFQKKEGYRFTIPKNEKIINLAQEPLLLFMLAVYDFEKTDLQAMSVKGNFNQSKLYDSLLNSFAERQLEKYKLYRDASDQTKREEEELFRLRLGMIALMMFLQDTTSKDIQKLDEELDAFRLRESKIQTSNVLGGFFFIHENKSTTEGEHEKYNYEFLHKTFGEFLTADFLLRVAAKQADRWTRNEEIFKFCFGYNWLHKHNNIQNFLYEHAHQILKPESSETKYVINEIITRDLGELFDKVVQNFPVINIRILAHKSKIEHLAIYSQNLIFLWLAMTKDKTNIKFEVYEKSNSEENTSSEPKYEAQDREENNNNKLLWKRLGSLWSLVGNKNATAKIIERITVSESKDSISLKKHEQEIKHNFSDAANVGCNDFEFLLSIFDNELKFSGQEKILEKIKDILYKKPELQQLGIDVILYRFLDFFIIYNLELVETLLEFSLQKRQKDSLLINIVNIKDIVSFNMLLEIFRLINSDQKELITINPRTALIYFEVLEDLKNYVAIDEIFQPRVLEEILYTYLSETRHSKGATASVEYFRFFDKVIKLSSFERIIEPRLIDELLFRPFEEFESYITSPIILVEYLKLLNNLSHYIHIQKVFSLSMFENLFYRLAQVIRRVDNSQVTIEFLNTVIEFGKILPIERIIDSSIIEGLVNETSNNFRYLVRSNPKTALEYLNTISKLDHHFVSSQMLEDLFDSRFFEEIFHREFDFRGRFESRQYFNYSTYTEYLKLLNQTKEFFPFKKFINREVVERLLSIGWEEYRYEIINNIQIAINYLQLANDFNLLNHNPILSSFPRLESMYSTNPTQFSEFLETFIQMD